MITGRRYQAVTIGCSAGGVHALGMILSALPKSFSLPIVVVCHVAAGGNGLLAELLAGDCMLPLKEAEEKEPILAGHVYVAPADYHLLVEDNHTFSLSMDPKVAYSRPSLDVLFESMAETYGENLIGIVLTGANEDGSHGLKTIREYGGVAIVQEPRSAYATIMPKAAIDIAGADFIEPLQTILSRLISLSEVML